MKGEYSRQPSAVSYQFQNQSTNQVAVDRTLKITSKQRRMPFLDMRPKVEKSILKADG